MAYEALTRDFLRAWNAHDADAAAALMTDDCVFEPSIGPYPWVIDCKGATAFGAGRLIPS